MVMDIGAPTFEGDGVALILSIVGPASAVSGGKGEGKQGTAHGLSPPVVGKTRYGSLRTKTVRILCHCHVRRRAARVALDGLDPAQDRGAFDA